MRGIAKMIGVFGSIFGIIVGLVKLSNECGDQTYFACILRSVGLTMIPPEIPRTGAPSQPRIVPIDTEVVYWNSVKDSGSVAEILSYLEKYPDGRFVAIARARVAGLQRPPVPTPGPPMPEPPPRPRMPVQAIEAFVTEEFLNGAHRWAATVDFYGTPGLSRAEVERRREGFFAECPRRSFDVDRHTFEVSEKRPGNYRVRFCYNYSHVCRNSRPSGRAGEDMDIAAVGNGFEVTRSLHRPSC